MLKPPTPLYSRETRGYFFAMTLFLKGYPIARPEINRDIINSYRKKQSLARLLTLAVDQQKMPGKYSKLNICLIWFVFNGLAFL